MPETKVVVFLGSARPGRLGERVAKFVLNALKKSQYNFSTKLIDPLELNFPVLQEPLHFLQDPTIAPEKLRRLNEDVVAADAFIFISPEYNRTVGCALTNTVNHVPPPSFADKPVGIVTYSYGIQGGAVAASQLRGMIGELKAISIPSWVLIPNANTSVQEDGTTDQATSDHSIHFVDQLAVYAQTLKNYKLENPR